MDRSESLPIALDHVYLLVAENAPETTVLQAAGLRPYARDARHDGQGMASRSLLFKNMYIELLWVRDAQEMIQHAEQTGLDLLEAEQQWRETGATPFGVAFHYTNNTSTLPVSVNRYETPWMPESSWIDMLPKTSIYEPEYFVVSDKIAYINLPDPFPDSEHPIGVQRLTQLCITVTNSAGLGPMTQLLVEHNILQIREGPTPLMELTFDENTCGKSFDCRPTLPLVIRY
jgi:hypothetical protein